jgi:hypothetical protein
LRRRRIRHVTFAKSQSPVAKKRRRSRVRFWPIASLSAVQKDVWCWRYSGHCIHLPDGSGRRMARTFHNLIIMRIERRPRLIASSEVRYQVKSGRAGAHGAGLILTHSGSEAESEATPERRLLTAELFREVPEFIDRFDVPVLRTGLPHPFRVRRRKARDLVSPTCDPVQLYCIRCFAARPFPERDPRSVSFISMRQGPPRLAGAAVLLTPEFHRFRN